MTINADIQTLEPGAMLSFFEVDGSDIGTGVLRFHGNNGSGPLFWQGQEYAPWAIRAEGFARTSEQQPNPKLSVANLDGSISLLCLTYEDMVGAVVTRRRTFAKYLDAVNFPDGINPTADPTQEFPPDVWFIERKASESREAVEFELASVLDFQGIKLPRRQILADMCPSVFVYRGQYCNYTGPAVADEFDNPTSNMALDKCGRRLSSCNMRVWPGGVLNFGGFPAAGLVRT